MVHTLPDYTTKYRLTTVFGGLDLGELAARLKSIDTIDRRGNIVWMDDFEDNINKWDSALLGTGAALALSNATARNGALCAKSTTGDDTGDVTEMYHWMPLPVSTRLGFEFHFALGSNIDKVRLDILINDGEDQHRGYIDFDITNSKIVYLSGWDAETDRATGISFYVDDKFFNAAKLVIDYTTRKYVRLLFNDITYDMSTFDLPSDTNTAAPVMRLRLSVYNAASGNHYCYIDDAIVTQNEP